MERTAAALAAWRDDVAAVSRQDANACLVRATLELRHDAAGDEPDSGAPVAARQHQFGDVCPGHAALSRREHALHLGQPFGQQLQQPTLADEGLESGLLIRPQAKADHIQGRVGCEDSVQDSLANRPLGLVLGLGDPARGLDDLAVPHAGRAGRLTRPAVEALVDVLAEFRIVGADPALVDRDRLIDPTARRVHLQAQGAVRGTEVQTQPAPHALLQDAPVELHRHGRHKLAFSYLYCHKLPRSPPRHQAGFLGNLGALVSWWFLWSPSLEPADEAARVESPVWVELLLQRAHDRKGVADFAPDVDSRLGGGRAGVDDQAAALAASKRAAALDQAGQAVRRVGLLVPAARPQPKVDDAAAGMRQDRRTEPDLGRQVAQGRQRVGAAGRRDGGLEESHALPGGIGKLAQRRPQRLDLVAPQALHIARPLAQLGQIAKLALDGLLEAEGGHDERAAGSWDCRLAGAVGRRARVEQLERGNPERGAIDGGHRFGGVLDRAERRQQHALALWKRVELEAQLHDDADGPKRADVQLVEVVARHVLDDSAAGLADHPVGVDHPCADDQVARRAVEQAQWPTSVGSDDSANRGSVLGGRVEREELALGPKTLLESA